MNIADARKILAAFYVEMGRAEIRTIVSGKTRVEEQETVYDEFAKILSEEC